MRPTSIFTFIFFYCYFHLNQKQMKYFKWQIHYLNKTECIIYFIIIVKNYIKTEDNNDRDQNHSFITLAISTIPEPPIYNH